MAHFSQPIQHPPMCYAFHFNIIILFYLINISKCAPSNCLLDTWLSDCPYRDTMIKYRCHYDQVSRADIGDDYNTLSPIR